jgi:hypothetical protein
LVERWLIFKLSFGIYSAVFLNRADMFGALTIKEEHNEIMKLVRGFILALEVAATSERYIGLRYSRPLQGLYRGPDGAYCQAHGTRIKEYRIRILLLATQDN